LPALQGLAISVLSKFISTPLACANIDPSWVD